ncbi:MAG: glycosyltransferase family 2 protein [Hydrogenophilales bacterium]|nr:glycosyltransferase family 2 protein [Hydrogenophilales bacterium]
MSKPSRVCIVLVNWNGWRDTIECLESVFRLDYTDFTVVVCDNDSSDDSLERIKEWARGELIVSPSNPTLAHLVTPSIPKPLIWADYDRAEAERGGDLAEHPPLVLIQTGANLGFAGGNNVGFRYALARGDADYIWALNNDTVVDAGALRALIDRMGETSGRGIVGSTLIFYAEPDRVQAFGCASYSKKIGLAAPIGCGCSIGAVPVDPTSVEKNAAYVVGASMLVSRTFLEQVGLMCEDYFLYFEELDWAERGRKLGFSSLYAPLSIVYHKVGAATKKTPRSKGLSVSERCSCRNRLLVTKRFFPEAQFWVKSRLALEGMKALLRGRTEEAHFVFSAILGR